MTIHHKETSYFDSAAHLTCLVHSILKEMINYHSLWLLLTYSVIICVQVCNWFTHLQPEWHVNYVILTILFLQCMCCAARGGWGHIAPLMSDVCSYFSRPRVTYIAPFSCCADFPGERALLQVTINVPYTASCSCLLQSAAIIKIYSKECGPVKIAFTSQPHTWRTAGWSPNYFAFPRLFVSLHLCNCASPVITCAIITSRTLLPCDLTLVDFGNLDGCFA